jgi:putative ABC transport system permease protein
MSIRFLLRPGVRRLFRLPLRTTATIHADVDDELESLIASRVDSLLARGMSPGDARAEALRRLGASLDDARHQLHQSAEHREHRMKFRERLESVAQDIGYAARGLARRPAFTAVAVITLAIGIGATTAIFSAVNVLLLRTLPFAKPDELMAVSLVFPGRNGEKGTDQMVWSYPKFVVFRDAQKDFSDLAVYEQAQYTVTSGDPELIRGEDVGATYMRTLGLSPVRGHDFERTIDAHGGAAREVIISYAFWERRFNADPTVVGRTIDLDRNPYTIIGVAPPNFLGLTGHAEVFVPVTTRDPKELGQQFSHEFFLVGRRKPGVSADKALADATVIGKRISEIYPDPVSHGANWSATARPLNAGRVAPIIRRSLMILVGAVGCVLLIACVNVANLLLGRASGRRREIAVRLAMGAGRGRLVRLLLTESLLLALIGGVASVAVAWLGAHALSTLDLASMLRGKRFAGNAVGLVSFSSVQLDWSALAFTLGVSIVVGVLFGLAPAIDATRASLVTALKDGGDSRRLRGGRPSAARRSLVVLEVALAIVLLAGSGLMIRSLAKLLAIDPGFDARHVLTLRLTVPPGTMARDSMPGFYTQLLDRIRAVPGVADASMGNCPPLNGGCNSTLIEFLDRPKVSDAQLPPVGVNWATPTLFSTLRIPLKRGRVFTNADRAGAQKVTVVNETAAKTFWPNEDPIGKHVGIGQGGMSNAEVIGIVGDVRQNPDSAAKPDTYIPYLQSPSGRMMIFVRTLRDPSAAANEVRRVIHDVAPQYPVYDLQTMSARAAGATSQTRFIAVLLALFAATALSLAAIGIYGVKSLAVAARSKEIGIRVALGADQGRVQRLVVGEGLALVTVGATIGLAAALVATRVLQSMLFDLTPSDPATYASIVGLLGFAAIVASWLPARRASRVDPVVALRAE